MHIIMDFLLSATIIILQCMYCSSANMTGNFIEIPSSVTIEVENGVEMDAVFRCRHQRTEAGIGWLINGSSSRLNPDVMDGFILDSNDTRTDTLAIPAIPEYNGTEVVCVATVFEESLREVTPPANLIIIVTREAATQPPPPTTVEPGFMMTPSSLNKTVEQGEAVFSCQHWSSDDIIWRVNGTSIISRDNISESRVPVGDGHFIYSLSITTLPGFNNTTIECGAVFFDNFHLLFTPQVTLLIQGIPGNISTLGCERNYSSGTLTTFWDPLPTLDITDRDPDIIYRVQIFNTTCGQSVLMSDENVTESITRNSLSPRELFEIYSAIITPRNNVSGYVNGPKREMKEKFMPLNGMTLFELSKGLPKTIKSVEPVPLYYTMVLEPLDGIGSNLRVNISVERNREMVTMQTGEPLPPRRLWTALILPYDCEVDMAVAELSTHDIQNVVSVNPSRPGTIHLKGDFVDASGATGVLWVVYSLINDSDIQYVYTAKQQNTVSKNVTGLIGINYGVSSFALENGLPFPRVVTLPTNITVSAADNDDRERIPTSVQYELNPTSTGLCITCIFPMDSSATDCVAVVHQRISQLNSSGLMNIESSHKFSRSGDTAYGCIEGVNLEQYQVGVVGGRKVIMEPDTMRTEVSNTGAITAGIVLGVVVFVAVMVILFIVVCTHLKRRHKMAPEPVNTDITHHSQTHTIVTRDSDSRPENHYESAGLPERPAEEQPLLPPPPPPLPARVEDDGGSSPGVSIQHVLGSVTTGNSAGDPTYASILAKTPNTVDYHTHTSPTADNSAGDSTVEEDPPPFPPRLMDDGPSTPGVSESALLSTPHQVTADSGAGSLTYAPVLTTTPNIVSQPAATEKVSYEDIQKYQNEQGQHYALPQLKITSKKGPVDDLHQVVYSKVKSHSITHTGDQNIDCASDCPASCISPPSATPPPIPSRETSTVAVCESITTDQLFSFLLPYASKWQSLGIALSLDEDQLDEVYTNNETDEACLQEMLELYMMRSDLEHSWEEIQAALEKIESSSDAPTSVQEVSPSQNSAVIGGNTVLMLDMDDTDTNTNHVEEFHGVGQQCMDHDHNVFHQFSVDIQPAVGTEESSDHEQEMGNDSDYSSSHLEDECTNLEASENNRPTPVYLSGELKVDTCSYSAVGKEDRNNNEENFQEESSDPGYGCSQPSETESNDNCVVLEMEDNSTNIFQASSKETRLVLNLNNSLSENLEDHKYKYKSTLDHPSSSEATVAATDCVDNDRELDHTTNEEHSMLFPCESIISFPCSAGQQHYLQVEGFCEKLEDPRNDKELIVRKTSHFLRQDDGKVDLLTPDMCNSCPTAVQDQCNDEDKTGSMHCQDSRTHKNYTKTLMRQMGFQMDLHIKVRDKLQYIDAIKESSWVHIGHEYGDQQVQHASKLSHQEHVNNFCVQTTSTALDIPKVPLCVLVCPTNSLLH